MVTKRFWFGASLALAACQVQTSNDLSGVTQGFGPPLTFEQPKSRVMESMSPRPQKVL